MLKRLLFFLLICSFAETVLAQQSVDEARLKAAFIYNFTKYIDWGTQSDDNNFVIGVLGSSPVTQALQEIANTNTVSNKKIVIKVFSRPSDIDNCDILFIPQKNSFSLQSVLDHVVKGVLTVSEEDGFARQGTAFNFVVKNDKLKFEANLKAINSAGLKAGSQLLKLATIVEENKKE